MLLTEYDEAAAMGLFKEEGRKEGWEEGRKEGRAEGKILGAVETCKDLGMDNNSIVQRLMTKFSLTRTEAESYVLATA